jgi:hypothetical protein
MHNLSLILRHGREHGSIGITKSWGHPSIVALLWIQDGIPTNMC